MSESNAKLVTEVFYKERQMLTSWWRYNHLNYHIFQSSVGGGPADMIPTDILSGVARYCIMY